MRTQEINVYREIQRNTEMAMKAIDTIADKVYDDQLSMQIARQSLKYSEIHDKAYEKLLQYRAEPYHANHLSNMMLTGAINSNTLLNTSTGHLAEIMIKGSNNNMVALNKVLNRNEEAGEQPLSLARQLLDAEEKNVERLKRYL